MRSRRPSDGCAPGSCRSSSPSVWRSGCELLVLALLLVGCAAAVSVRGVPFHVEASGMLAAYGGGELGTPAKLAVAADPTGKADLGRLVGRELPGDVLVGVFGGVQPTGGHSVSISAIRVDADHVTIAAEFTRPSPSAIVTQVITSPFVVASISRGDLPSGRLRFTLVDASGREIDAVALSVR